MNERERLALLARNRARLKTALADPRRRSDPAQAVSGGKAQPKVERWKDGTPKDPILAIEESIDLERWREDREYGNRPEVLAAMNKLITLRAQRDAKAPPPPTPGPTQAEYERDRTAILARQKQEVLEREIEKLQERKSAMEGVE
jgi:hypothetical protein